MARGFQGAVLRGLGATDHTLTVVAVQDITAHFRRITFHAPSLFTGTPIEPASWLRLWIPDPDGSDREFQRGYTLVQPDEERQLVSIDVVLHEPAGPASVWASTAAAGDSLVASRYGSTKFAVPDPVPDGFLLVGDPASLPGINSVIARIPQDRPIELILEQSHEHDLDIPITAHPGLTVRWVRRTGDAEVLAQAVDGRDWSNWYAWVGAETAATRGVRNRLKELGFPKAEVKAQAYWAAGKAMGVSRDGGEDTAAAAAVPPAVDVPSADVPLADVPLTDVRPAAPEPVHRKREPSVPTPSGVRRWRSQAGSELLRPLRGKLVVAAICQAFVSVLELAPFVVLVEVCRRLLSSGTDDPGALRALGFWGLGLVIAAGLCSGLLLLALHIMDAEFGRRTRRLIIAKLVRMPLGQLTERGSGRIKQAVQDDVTDLHYLVTHAVLDMVRGLLTPLVILAYLFTVDSRLAALLLVPIVVFGVLTTRMLSGSKEQIPVHAAWIGKVTNAANAYLDGLAVVRTYDGGPTGTLATMLRERSAFLAAWQRPFLGAKTVLTLVSRPMTSLLLICVVGSLMVVGGAMSPADLVAFLVLGVAFGSQLLSAGYGSAGIRDGLAAARRIGLLLTGPELDSPESAATSRPSTASARAGVPVRFEQVRFGYDAGHTVIDDVDLDLAPGTLTALVGPSGSGKSTLAELLARFHDLDAGSIRVDGTDLRDLPAADLYSMVGFVFQETRLVRGTIRDNIALARPDAGIGDVRAAAIAAQLADRIESLPKDYDSVVGVDVRLSGGEAQRLMIARTLLADPKVLILDEATAYADPESEDRVQRALSELLPGRTVLVIAHRLHTVTTADQIAVMEHGRIVQRGTHAELLGTPGLYRHLWQATTGVAQAQQVGGTR